MFRAVGVHRSEKLDGNFLQILHRNINQLFIVVVC